MVLGTLMLNVVEFPRTLHILHCLVRLRSRGTSPVRFPLGLVVELVVYAYSHLAKVLRKSAGI